MFFECFPVVASQFCQAGGLNYFNLYIHIRHYFLSSKLFLNVYYYYYYYNFQITKLSIIIVVGPPLWSSGQRSQRCQTF
jgi:hypothetical protein